MTTTTTVSTALNNQDLAKQFNDQGYVILKQWIDTKIVEGTRNALSGWVDQLAHQLVNEGVNDTLYADEPFETRLVRVVSGCPHRMVREIRKELHWPQMFGLFFNAKILDVVEALLGPEIRLYPNYTVRPKLPEMAITQVPWHQDAAFTASGHHGSDPNAGDLKADQLRMVNAWSPLVPAYKINGCMQFIPKSHKLGIVPHEKKAFEYLEITPEALAPRLKDAINIELDPGDVVLFSNMMFHVGQPNLAKSIRWSCDWRYQDATQSTMRTEKGHLARSTRDPKAVVRNATHWASLSFA